MKGIKIMYELNELELASVVGGFTINHNSNNISVNVNANANLSTSISQHGKVTGGSAVSSGNTVIQNSPTLPF